MFVASASRKIPTTGNRPSRPATERRRVGDPSTLIVALEDLPLFIALVLAVPFAARPSTRLFFEREEQEEAKERSPERGRKRDKRERSRTSAMEGPGEVGGAKEG